MTTDKGKSNTLWIVEKYKGDYRSSKEIRDKGIKPYEVLSFEGNLLLNEGINELFTIICGGVGTLWDEANSYIGVGNSTSPALATQTGLIGPLKCYKAVDEGYPIYGTLQKATWKATFLSGDANYSWQECTLCNGSDDTGKNLNRKVQVMGAKEPGMTWIITLVISLS